MQISIIGAGYVGLITAAHLVSKGHKLIVIDKNEKRIKELKKGITPFYEKGLDAIIKLYKNEFIFTTNISRIKETQVIFCAVGTPAKETGETDLSPIYNCAKEIAEHINPHSFYIIRSTVPVGTCKDIKQIILNKKAENGIVNFPFSIISNPEFLREGSALDDSRHPDRIVIGIEDSSSKQFMLSFYKNLYGNSTKILIYDFKTSEMIKYASNVFLAARISLINEMSQFCDKKGIDIKNISKGIGMDRRIGHAFLRAGIGYGGSCFPKDVQSLCYESKKSQCYVPIMDSIEKTNKNQFKAFTEKIVKFYNDKPPKILTIWGVAFKAGSDDTRGSFAFKLSKEISKIYPDTRICFFDPIVKIAWSSPSIEDSLNNSDGLIILTEDPMFKMIPIKKIAELLSTPIIFDGRNYYSRRAVESTQIKYIGIGS